MAFWGSDLIRERQNKELIFDPYLDKKLSQGCYHLSVGPEAFITGDREKTVIDVDGQISIDPGQFALLLTEEMVYAPMDAIGLISIRYKIKSRGLINVSGFHVDPGFRGRLKFGVHNAGPDKITLARGDDIFLIWFCGVGECNSDKPYDGHHNYQRQITSGDVDNLRGLVASPASLKKDFLELKTDYDVKISRLELSLSHFKGLAQALLFLVIGTIATLIFKAIDTKNSSHPTSVTQPQNIPSIYEKPSPTANPSGHITQPSAPKANK